jgi:hypothetical protein
MRPKITENAKPKKMEKESQRKFYYVSDRELIENLKNSLKNLPPGRVERGCGGRL